MRERKHPVHWPSIERGNRPVIIFLTVCAEKRKPILANDDAAGVILEAWRDADHWLVGRYIIVPDHIHLLRARETRCVASKKMGGVLEEQGIKPLAVS